MTKKNEKKNLLINLFVYVSIIHWRTAVSRPPVDISLEVPGINLKQKNNFFQVDTAVSQLL